jgi:hypothetical protein
MNQAGAVVMMTEPEFRPAAKSYLWTGQRTCHDTDGLLIACAGSGQDAEFARGVPWPEPRFETDEGIVLDRLTGLTWTRNTNPAGFPLTWEEAMGYVAGMNREQALGYTDWRLPNRRELRSVMSHQTRKPALPEGHPFTNIFTGWVWTSTTAMINPAYAWCVHMEGARMFYGSKEQYELVWPVRGSGNGVLPATGQICCYNSRGNPVPCGGSGQDAEFRFGGHWPDPRFEADEITVTDRLTGLCWMRNADLTGTPVTWSEAITAVGRLNKGAQGQAVWRLPNINELESLVDCNAHSPALPSGHPFSAVREFYWSSTTSMFEPDWAWALYLAKGAVGVGQKKGPHFFVWAVSGPA